MDYWDICFFFIGFSFWLLLFFCCLLLSFFCFIDLVVRWVLGGNLLELGFFNFGLEFFWIMFFLDWKNLVFNFCIFKLVLLIFWFFDVFGLFVFEILVFWFFGVFDLFVFKFFGFSNFLMDLSWFFDFEFVILGLKSFFCNLDLFKLGWE